MALIVDFVNVVGNLVIGTGDDYFIASNVVRQGSVRTSGLNTSLIIDGTILNNVGTAVFADHNTTSANNGNSIVIGETGRVISVGTNSNSLAVAVFGVGSSFTNHGQVTSIASGVAMWDDPVIGLNTGLIEATGGGVTTHYGVLLGAGSIFTNTGTIAQLGDGAGVIGRDGTATLNNTGVISGAFSYNGEFFSLDSVDIINNSGQMIGDVNLGNLDDTYDGRGGTVIGEILGGSGDDTLFGGAGEEIIRGGADNDTIRGGGARDELYGEDGNDLILGQDGKDLLDGGAGEDELRGGDGEDSLIGGAGEDT
ncbi:MAG: calcium-binding protein, partial [Pseudomonadota bacterium]